MSMRRREFLLGAPGAAAGALRTPPNILFIMPDQWRGCDLGCAGNAQVRTPNLDRLATEGVRFSNLIANTPVCTPARGMLLTGKYPHTTGTAVNDIGLADKEVTIAEILSAQGYYTGFVGKWHLEGGKRLPGFVPPGRRQGFQFWAANECSHDYFHQQYFRDDPAPIRMPGYETFTWTDLAIEFLDRAREKKRPFCLYLEYGAPHDPYLIPPGLENMYRPKDIVPRKNWQPGVQRGGSVKDIAGYYAAIACLDREIGRLLKRLDQSGLRDNTMVLFLSDHGDLLGSHGSIRKQKPWEESVVVPGMLRWPAALKAGVTSEALISHVDVVPTLLGLCGVRPTVKMHGFDYARHLRSGRGRTPERAHLAIYTKTELNQYDAWRGLRTRKYKYARFKERPWVLYDLEKDPYELENLVASPAMRPVVERFDREIGQFMRRTGDRWDELQHRPYV